MKRFKTNKAITLITLIITIIVLLILAGVTINMVLGENGLFNKAKTSVAKYENEQEKEKKIDINLEILDKNDKIIQATSREETWKGATMLTISISNVTGGTFTINVNNVEARNYKTLYYYVNDYLVYKGTEPKFQVTSINGIPIEDGKTYEVKVLSEPFTISVTTGEGDNINTWLACIGNTNEQGYSIESIDDLLNNKELISDLINSNDALEYLIKSREILLPKTINSIKGTELIKKLYNKMDLNISLSSNNTTEVQISGSSYYSSDDSNYYKVFDGQVAEHRNTWVSANTTVPQFLKIDFKNCKEIYAISMYPQICGNFNSRLPKNIHIDYLDENNNWLTAFEGQTDGYSSDWHYINFDKSVKAKSLKLTFNSNWANNYTSIAEMKLYGITD